MEKDFRLRKNSNTFYRKFLTRLPLPHRFKRRIASNDWLFENSRLVLPKNKLKKIINYDLDNYFYNNEGSVQSYMFHDFDNYMVDDVLMKVDKMSMKHSIEVRTPFLDQRIVTYAKLLDSNLKFNDLLGGKALLKQELIELLGDKFVNRKKMGFGIPLNEWMRTIFKNDIENILYSEVFSDYCDVSELRNLYKDFVAGEDYSAFFYNVLVLGKWIGQND